MLASVQRFDVPELGIERVFHGIFHPRIWIHIVSLRGAIADERLTRCLGARRPVQGRKLVGLTLSGVTSTREPVEVDWAEGNGVIVCDGRSLLSGGTNALVHPSLTVNIDWDAAYFGSSARPAAVGLVSRRDLVASLVRELAESIDAVWRAGRGSPVLEERLVALFDVMRADGYPLPEVRLGDLSENAYDELRATSRALDLALSLSSARPTLVDLETELGVGARTVMRRLPAVLSAWGYEPDGFRDLRKRSRLFQACALMSHPRATVELAAKTLGFATPNSFCRAFLKQGLPSPGRVHGTLASFY